MNTIESKLSQVRPSKPVVDGFQKALRTIQFHGTDHFIQNLSGRCDLIKVNGSHFPAYIPNHTAQNECYLGSITSQYVTYGLEEWEASHGRKWWMESMEMISTSFFRLTQIDKTIHINANMLATAFAPSQQPQDYRKAAEFAQKRYPQHAIVFRCMTPSETMKELEADGYFRLTNRKVYEVDLSEGMPIKKRPLAQDQKRWDKQTEFSWRTINWEDKFEMAQILSMYNAVYRERHSQLNPNYTPGFVKLALQSSWLEGEVIVDTHDRPVGVQLYLVKNGCITTPFIGYDTSLPKQTRIYPYLNLRLMHKARENGYTLNMSSGAGTFKKQRGGVGKIEYLMVKTNHLPFFRRLPWIVLTYIANKWVKAYLETHDI